MTILQPFHLRRLSQYQPSIPSDWKDGEMRQRWYPLWWLMRSPVFSEMQFARLVALKGDWLRGERRG